MIYCEISLNHSLKLRDGPGRTMRCRFPPRTAPTGADYSERAVIAFDFQPVRRRSPAEALAYFSANAHTRAPFFQIVLYRSTWMQILPVRAVRQLWRDKFAEWHGPAAWPNAEARTSAVERFGCLLTLFLKRSIYSASGSFIFQTLQEHQGGCSIRRGRLFEVRP